MGRTRSGFATVPARADPPPDQPGRFSAVERAASRRTETREPPAWPPGWARMCAASCPLPIPYCLGGKRSLPTRFKTVAAHLERNAVRPAPAERECGTICMRRNPWVRLSVHSHIASAKKLSAAGARADHLEGLLGDQALAKTWRQQKANRNEGREHFG